MKLKCVSLTLSLTATKRMEYRTEICYNGNEKEKFGTEDRDMCDHNISDSRELEFAVFCIEEVASKLGISADKVYEALAEKKRHPQQLHHTGVRYTAHAK